MESYTRGTFRSLLESDAVTEPTRKVLIERMTAGENYVARFFADREYAVLHALCRAVAPSDVVPPYFAPSEIDKRLADDIGNGWRYATMPSDGEAYLRGLRELNRIAAEEHERDFTDVTREQQIEILKRFNERRAGVSTEGAFDHQLFFEEFLTEFAEIYYSHPLAQEEIGYIGFADAHGWDLGPNGPGIEVHRRKPEYQENKNEQPETGKRDFYSNFGTPVDAVVIGTGAGGAPILARLARAGLKVVALEAGKRFDHRKFPTDERAQAGLFWNDERLSAGADPVHFGSNNSGCGVGGTTLHFTAFTPRPQADDLRLFSEFGVGRDWCLSLEDLEPYFEELEWFLGVSGVNPYPWGKPRAKGYPLPPLLLNGPARLMQRGCERLNIKTAPAPNAALSAAYFREEIGWRNACTNRGFCQAGCSVGAKGSMDVTFLPLAEKFGAEIRPECFVTGFEFDPQQRIKAVVYSQNGETKKQLCKNVFLCAGAIETPRLLLINGLANSSGQVGRNFMTHPGLQIWGVFDESVYPHKGIPGGLISEDTHRPKDADFAGGYLVQSVGVMPVTYVSQLARSEEVFGSELAGRMDDYNHTAGIDILGECLPHEHNFLELSEEKDGRGLPKPRVHFSHGLNERRLTAHAEKLMREIWSGVGARRLWAFPRSAHIIGTCRMGNDAADSVVDANCRSYDIPNLYICDNSVFPSALSVNPSLTIMALALRTADIFLDGS